MADRAAVTPFAAPVFTGRARWVAAVILVLGPLLQVVEFLLAIAPEDNPGRVAWWVAHLAQTDVSMAAGLLGVPCLLGGAAVLVALCHRATPRLAATAGGLMLGAMLGLGALHGYELAAYGLAKAGDTVAAVAVLDAADLGLTGIVLFILFLAGAVLGTLTLAAAAWRSPLLPRWVPVFMLAFAVLDFAASQAVLSHVVNLVAFGIAAAAVVQGYVRRPKPA